MRGHAVTLVETAQPPTLRHPYLPPSIEPQNPLTVNPAHPDNVRGKKNLPNYSVNDQGPIETDLTGLERLWTGKWFGRGLGGGIWRVEEWVVWEDKKVNRWC